jgi:hypothetical protein
MWPQDRHHVQTGLRRAGLDARAVPEVWCDVPVDVARARFAERAAEAGRHPVHAWPLEDDTYWSRIADAATPLGLGPGFTVDTTRPLSDQDIGRLALSVRATFV